METLNREILVQCPTCRNVLQVNREVPVMTDPCPICQSAVEIRVFPRLFREPVPTTTARPAGETESACAFFPDLKAEKVCDACGSLMSSRATAVWGDEEVCLPCLFRLREEVKSPRYLPKAALQENRALALVTIFAPLSLITAPLALVLLFRCRKGEGPLLRRSRRRWWVAFWLAVAWILVWGAILVAWASLILEELS